MSGNSAHYFTGRQKRNEKSENIEKDYFGEKLIFSGKGENDQILAFLRFRPPKTPKIPLATLTFHPCDES